MTSKRPKPRARYWYRRKRCDSPTDTLQGFELLFYGDSITQCWRFGHTSLPPSTSFNSLCHGAPDVFAKHFGSRYNAQVFGIGGDQTAHLMYRLLHGEDPAGLGTRVAVLLIGTNDLGYALDHGAAYMQHIVPSVWQHVEAIVNFLMDRVQHVLLMGACLCCSTTSQTSVGWTGVLQRGNWHTPDIMFVQPSEFTEAINTINVRLETYAAQKDGVHYVDCSSWYLVDQGTRINKDVMPDSLHPNAAGFELMAQCLEGTVAKLMGDTA